MATEESAGREARTLILVGGEKVEVAGVVRDDLGVGLDGDFDAAGGIDDSGETAVIRGNNGQTVAKSLENNGGGILSHTGDTEHVA